MCVIIMLNIDELMLSTLCLKKKPDPLRLVWHNFTNSQHLLIGFGGQRRYSVLSWLCKSF